MGRAPGVTPLLGATVLFSHLCQLGGRCSASWLRLLRRPFMRPPVGLGLVASGCLEEGAAQPDQSAGISEAKSLS